MFYFYFQDMKDANPAQQPAQMLLTSVDCNPSPKCSPDRRCNNPVPDKLVPEVSFPGTIIE
jgi:hypothetical protein